MTLKLGDEFLRCAPFAYVVSQKHLETICDFCFAEAPRQQIHKKCVNCKFVHYCNKNCQRLGWKIHKDECKYLMAVAPRQPTDTVRLIGRILLALESGGDKEYATLPDGSRRYFHDLESHVDEVINDNCRYPAFNCFFAILREMFREKIPPKSEVLEIFGRILINSFNIMDADYNSIGVGLYLAPSVLDHSCEPNAAVAFDGRLLYVRCISKEKNLKFSDMRISYLNVMWDTTKRQKALKEQYYFDCKCYRCKDLGNLETFLLATMKCYHCKCAIPMEGPNLHNDEIKCHFCQLTIPAKHTEKYWNLKQEITKKVILNESKHPEPNEQYYGFLEDMIEVFHPFEQIYHNALELCYEHFIEEEKWEKALICARQLLVAYRKFYPRYDVNTGLLYMKVAKILHFQGQFIQAKESAEKAHEIFTVTHSKLNPIFVSVLEDILAEERAMMGT